MPQGTHSRHGDGVALREEEHASRWTLSATLGPVDVMLAQLQVRSLGGGREAAHNISHQLPASPAPTLRGGEM